ncbi:MAG: stage III sporulation protein AA, partial [Tissierellia bacterium]|nr:stage III sporulation protein AA [Tissierellia bacterium]
VIDERSEIAGMYNGVPQHDIGPRTDVLDGCNKQDGTMMLLRAMSPEIIAMDEIGSIADVEAIHEIIKAGVKIIATVHGSSVEDLMSRRSLSILINERIFKRYIFLDNSLGVGTVKKIIDGETFNPVNMEKG